MRFLTASRSKREPEPAPGRSGRSDNGARERIVTGGPAWFPRGSEPGAFSPPAEAICGEDLMPRGGLNGRRAGTDGRGHSRCRRYEHTISSRPKPGQAVGALDAQPDGFAARSGSSRGCESEPRVPRSLLPAAPAADGRARRHQPNDHDDHPVGTNDHDADPAGDRRSGAPRWPSPRWCWPAPADYVWLPGYWTWRDNRYEWMAGQWVIPPHANAVWIAPHWDTESGGYRFYEGYWN